MNLKTIGLKLNNSDIEENSNPDLIKELEKLKEEIASLKTANETPQEDRPYVVNGEPATLPEKENIKDIDLLLMKHENNQTELAYWERLKEKSNTLTRQTKSDTIKSESKKSIPYYTIPAGSDLGRTTLLSPLIGEVPVEGKLMQPLFSFRHH